MHKHLLAGALAGGLLFGGVASAISYQRPPLTCGDLLEPLASAVDGGDLTLPEAESIYQTCLGNPGLLNKPQ